MDYTYPKNNVPQPNEAKKDNKQKSTGFRNDVNHIEHVVQDLDKEQVADLIDKVDIDEN